MPDLGSYQRKTWRRAVPEMTCEYFPSMVLPAMKAALGQNLQHSTLDLVLYVIMAKASPSDPLTIFASLENTEISSGPMIWDTDDEKGYYQDKIDVTIWLQDSGGVIPYMRRIASAPDNVNGDASTSSTIDNNFSVGGNIGFFGGTPTGGVNAGAGTSDSNTFQKNLKDFRVEVDVHDKVVKQSYLMSASSGGPYKQVYDLVPDPNTQMSFGAHFSPIKLFDPPLCAVKSLPLLTQVVWQADDSTEYDAPAGWELHIEISQHLSHIEGTNQFFNVHTTPHPSINVKYAYVEPLPIHDLFQKVAPLT